MNELIEKSNSIKFYQDSDFHLESLNFLPSKNRLELFFSINQISYDVLIENEKWKISCEDTLDFRGFKNKILMPYVKIEILEEHPLLWQFKKVKTDFYIIEKPKNLKEFYGELAIILEKKCGNWIRLMDLFWNLEDCFSLNDRICLKLSDPLLQLMKEICEKHKIKFKIGDKIKTKEFNNKSDYKLLIFGNKDVSPNDYNLNQHYVIAGNFNCLKIK